MEFYHLRSFVCFFTAFTPEMDKFIILQDSILIGIMDCHYWSDFFIWKVKIFKNRAGFVIWYCIIAILVEGLEHICHFFLSVIEQNVATINNKNNSVTCVINVVWSKSGSLFTNFSWEYLVKRSSLFRYRFKVIIMGTDKKQSKYNLAKCWIISWPWGKLLIMLID